MAWRFQTSDGEKFLRKLAAEAHVSEQENVPTREADQFIEEITEEQKEDEEMVDVKKFRITEHWSAERTVTVKAVDEDHAKELAEEKVVNEDIHMSHKVTDEVSDLGKTDRVPLKDIETGDYYEDDE